MDCELRVIVVAVLKLTDVVRLAVRFRPGVLQIEV